MKTILKTLKDGSNVTVVVDGKTIATFSTGNTEQRNTDDAKEWMAKHGYTTQSMDHFFSRIDVTALQEIQKRNHPLSDAHIKATLKLKELAIGVGAGQYFESPRPKPASTCELLALVRDLAQHIAETRVEEDAESKIAMSDGGLAMELLQRAARVLPNGMEFPMPSC